MPSRPAEVYSRVAVKYEARFLDELDDKPDDRELLDRLAAEVDDPVVEVGCGPGQIGAYLRRQSRRVFGADISPGMAQRAAGRLDGAVVADMRALPFRAGTAGAVVAFYSVIHIGRDELAAVLREFGRVARPGGSVVVSAHEGAGELHVDEFLGEVVTLEATLYSLDELRSAAGEAGLEVRAAWRRQPYAGEGRTVRLYLEARRPLDGP